MISVSRPLDYEQIPNGLIYLTVMAKDAGNPPLNSTVSVTIEVFVSTQGCTGLTILETGVVSVLPECWSPAKTLCPHILGCPHSSEHVCAWHSQAVRLE